ncbi:MAG TPA: MYXO-CTERM sorting domain-containing protein [Anaeromyxobacteraceae bacterium]|nr:MYXO-CTERM sorting domain-containing protein [Anaeromyxobacteraceae bacterium]
MPRLVTALCALVFAAPRVHAATTTVGPGDSYEPIEAARPGDEVLLLPGTYPFRVYLTTAAPADRPIVIAAADPSHPPVFDLGGTFVEDAPGSYTGGDRGRGCWQISGGTNYQISGIVFTHCSNADANSAGLRYYNGASGIVLRNCVFRDNDNGLTGGSEDSDITVESSEFDGNGNLAAPSEAPTHNIYVYGGTFTLRYSYLHDPVQGQNFHIRSRNGTLEYNWIARAHSYEGDLMTDDDFSVLSPPYTQALLLRGNVIIQSAAPENHGQIIAVYNDAGIAGLSLDLRLVSNTVVGNGGEAALVHLSNADGTSMGAELSNNIISGTLVPTLVEEEATAMVSGQNNWIESGADPGPLTGSVQSADPGFRDPSAKDFTLAASSLALGGASPSVEGLPDREYYKDETQTCMYRLRTAVKDIGAFESTTTGLGLQVNSSGSPKGGASPGGCGSSGGSLSLPGVLLLLVWLGRRSCASCRCAPGSFG